MVEHWRVESDFLRFDSSWELKITVFLILFTKQFSLLKISQAYQLFFDKGSSGEVPVVKIWCTVVAVISGECHILLLYS